jgi:hypothetical protein
MATLNVTLHRKPQHKPVDPGFYFISFTDAPARYAFLLDKTPRFDSRENAFRALRHYEFEFDVHGYVCSKFGIEPEHAPTPEVQPE